MVKRVHGIASKLSMCVNARVHKCSLMSQHLPPVLFSVCPPRGSSEQGCQHQRRAELRMVGEGEYGGRPERSPRADTGRQRALWPRAERRGWGAEDVVVAAAGSHGVCRWVSALCPFFGEVSGSQPWWGFG